MKKRKDGRWVRKITLPDGTVKFFYSSADTEKKAIKDIEQQLLTFSQKSESENKVIDLYRRMLLIKRALIMSYRDVEKEVKKLNLEDEKSKTFVRKYSSQMGRGTLSQNRI